MKKTLLTTIAFGVAFSGILVFADTDVTIPSAPIITTVMPVTENEGVTLLTKLSRIQARGEMLIKARISSLSANASVITSDKSLSTDQKNALNTLISINTTRLVSLRAAIVAGTDAASTKSLVSSIFANFRIYAVTIPQIRLEKRIYDLQNHSIKLSNRFVTVQTKINEYTAKGKDVTIWQKTLDDTKSMVANDMNILATTMAKISTLKPADYGTTSKMIIETTNADLKLVLKDFNSINKNLRKPDILNNATNSKKIIGDGMNVPSPLIGTAWVWTSATQAGVTTSAPNTRFVLSFGEDNYVSRATDCNAAGGNYTLGANHTMIFGSFISTMMFCEGSHEGIYSSELTTTSAYKVEGSNLTLTTASGTMTFIRK
jgi:heat shock protein HslJ